MKSFLNFVGAQLSFQAGYGLFKFFDPSFQYDFACGGFKSPVP